MSRIVAICVSSITLLLLCGCATTKPALPTGADFNLPRKEIYAKYPQLRDYGLSQQLLVRKSFINTQYVRETWGAPDRTRLSWWNLFPPQIICKPAFWYWWAKGRYEIGLYYERPLILGWEPLGIRLKFKEKKVGQE